MDLFKKKMIKTMNNNMAINTYLSTIETKKQTKYNNNNIKYTTKYGNFFSLAALRFSLYL